MLAQQFAFLLAVPLQQPEQRLAGAGVAQVAQAQLAVVAVQGGLVAGLRAALQPAADMGRQLAKAFVALAAGLGDQVLGLRRGPAPVALTVGGKRRLAEPVRAVWAPWVMRALCRCTRIRAISSSGRTGLVT